MTFKQTLDNVMSNEDYDITVYDLKNKIMIELEQDFKSTSNKETLEVARKIATITYDRLLSDIKNSDYEVIGCSCNVANCKVRKNA